MEKFKNDDKEKTEEEKRKEKEKFMKDYTKKFKHPEMNDFIDRATELGASKEVLEQISYAYHTILEAKDYSTIQKESKKTKAIFKFLTDNTEFDQDFRDFFKPILDKKKQ